MEIGGIIKDSLRYPFSDWKKILILGIITVFSGISNIAVLLGTKNIAIIYILVIIGIVIGLFANGYLFKLLKSSLAGINELPEFNTWSDMFLNGIKLNIIGIVYEMPAILIILIFTALYSTLTLGSTGTIQFSVASIITDVGIETFKAGGAGGWLIVAILYMTLIYPISLMAMSNMAKNDNKLTAAFKFREILNKITNIGWGNLIEWYVMIGIIYYVLNAVMGLIILIIFSFHDSIVGTVLFSLIVTPYLGIFFYRSVALFYLEK